MALQYLFDPNKQFQSIGGVNEVSGFLRVFLNGTDDRATTYKNFDGTLNEADIVLDSYGRAVVIVDDTKTYRIEVYNRLGGLMWTVSNYKARGGSGGGSGTPVSVEGKVGEIDVDENTEGGVKHFVVSLAATIKNAIATLTMAVNGVANALNGKKDRQTPVRVSGGTTKTIVGISQDSDGVITPEFDDIAFPDWTSAINEAVDTCEKLENKKTTLTGYESSNTYYPTIKAVVDFVNGMLQNLGGKLITDNGDPFTDSSDLPSYTPYGGVDIADKDYAYVQGVGTAERWSATVSVSSVAWVQEYAISIPVFTPAQQAAIDSGITSTILGNLLTKTGDGSNVTAAFTASGTRTNISTGEKLFVIFGKIAKWFGDLKAVAFSGSYNDLSDKPTIPTVNNGTLTIKQNGTSKGTFSANQSTDTEINVTDTTYESKPEASGGTAVSLVTTGDKYTWNKKQNSLPYSGGKYGINVSGSAAELEKVSLGQVDTLPISQIVSSLFKAGTFLLKGNAYGGQPYVFGNVTIPNNQWYRFSVSGEGANYCVITLEPSTGGASSPFNIFKILVDNGSTREDKVMKVVRVPYETTTSEIGDSETPVYVDASGELKECSNVAKKASSGSGNLAVIDGNGNYSSSGISAYEQTMLNGLTSRLGSFVSAINSFSHSFNVIFNGSDISKTLAFENTYASIKFLRFGISYLSGKISYRLPWRGESADYNEWIIAPDTQTKNGKSIVHTTHTFTVAGNTNTEELYEENELGTTGQSVSSIFEKQITTSQTVRGRLSSEIRLYNGISYKELIVHVDIGYERLSSTGAFFAFGTVTCNTDLFEND